MQVYSITSVVNTYNDVAPNHGAAGVWFEVFSNKEDALNLLKQWGCEPLPNKENVFFMKKEDNGQVYNFYYTINSQFFAGV